MSQRLRLALPFAAVALVLLTLYLPTLQVIPNGSDDYYMIDVGETQVVLNVWGTLHFTGYPLYTILGNTLVAALRAIGAQPAAATALVSLLWGIVALGLIYALALNLTGRAILSAAVTLLFGLTRTVWIHHVIAEVYTFGLAILALLLLIALWHGPIRGRIYWLALIGGIGVAHHRALAMVAPALLFAAWTELTVKPRALPRIVIICLLLGLVGFLPYIYLPLRAQAHAAWVYGDPSTWTGFVDQFFGREASRFIGLPASWDALLANLNVVNTVLVTDLTLPGLIVGIAGLLIAVRTRYRRAALTMLISGVTAYAFHVALYKDILSALILPITLSVAFGWLFAAAMLLDWANARRVMAVVLAAGAALLAFALTSQNLPFVNSLTKDPTGLETIALAKETPPGATLMLAWGPRHFAVGFARDVLGQFQDIRLASHSANFRALAEQGPLVTPEYTFYNQPVEWWEARLGKVYLHAIAPELIEISTTPERAETQTLDSIAASVDCTDQQIVLNVTWDAPQTPTENLSVFVHLLDANDTVLAQADQSAPVYGWRPLTTWGPGEAVRDVYPLPRVEGATSIRYGLYRQTNGQFENVIEHALPVDCE